MKNTLKFLTLLAVVFTMASCSNDDDNNTPDPIVTYETTLTGANEVPANNSTAKGTAVLNYNKDTNAFMINVTHDIANPTAGHIHIGVKGENGPVEFPFTSLTSPITFTSPELTADQISALNDGKFYVNIHTEAFPDGEIRGNLMKK